MYKLIKTTSENDGPSIISNSPAIVVRDFKGIRSIDYYPYASGLVFWLDGINTGTNSINEWHDLVNDVTFTNYSSTTQIVKHYNHVYFPSGSSMTSTAALNFPYTTHTIEIVYEKPDSTTGTMFVPRTSNSVAFGIVGSTAAAIKTGASALTLNASNLKTGVHTVSIVYNGNVIHNGVDDVVWNASSSNNSWNIDTTGSVLGMRPGSANYQFTGKIYAIRVYNRLLNSYEMIHNQQIDILRYELSI